jgi:hypothetical protein
MGITLHFASKTVKIGAFWAKLHLKTAPDITDCFYGFVMIIALMR